MYKALVHGPFYKIRIRRICLKMLFSSPGSFQTYKSYTQRLVVKSAQIYYLGTPAASVPKMSPKNAYMSRIYPR